MSRESRVPLPTLERLATCFRYLTGLENAQSVTISSTHIEEATGISAVQFRKDLSHFGEFGKPGVGYNARELRDRLAAILKIDRAQPVILVGAGNLGSALVGYAGLRRHNFNIVGVFDRSAEKIGTDLWGLRVMDVSTLREANEGFRARIGIITVPAESAQSVADQLVDSCVRVILNFAPAVVRPKNGVPVRNVCFVQELSVLSYYLSPHDCEEVEQEGYCADTEEGWH